MDDDDAGLFALIRDEDEDGAASKLAHAAEDGRDGIDENHRNICPFVVVVASPEQSSREDANRDCECTQRSAVQSHFCPAHVRVGNVRSDERHECFAEGFHNTVEHDEVVCSKSDDISFEMSGASPFNLETKTYNPLPEQ